MHFCKDNKSPYHDISSFCISYEECKHNINILESIIEYILNIEKSLQEIIKHNVDLKNKIFKNDAHFNDLFEQNNQDIIKHLSKGKNHIEEIEKIINDFKKSIKEDSGHNLENVKEIEINTEIHNNKLDIEPDIGEIKRYYEGKMAIMEKKINVSEILENLYREQIDELKNKLNKCTSHKVKNYNEDIVIYDFH